MSDYALAKFSIKTTWGTLAMIVSHTGSVRGKLGFPIGIFSLSFGQFGDNSEGGMILNER